MKPRHLALPLLLVAPAGFCADQPAGASAENSRPSARLLATIRATLPTYAPTPATTETTGTDNAPTPGVLELPKMTIVERVEQRIDPDQLISPEDLLRKQKKAYLAELEKEGGLTRALNSFHIPLFSPSVAARSRAHYQNQKTKQLAATISAIGESDPAAARELRKELFNAPDRASLGNK